MSGSIKNLVFRLFGNSKNKKLASGSKEKTPSVFDVGKGALYTQDQYRTVSPGSNFSPPLNTERLFQKDESMKHWKDMESKELLKPEEVQGSLLEHQLAESDLTEEHKDFFRAMWNHKEYILPEQIDFLCNKNNPWGFDMKNFNNWKSIDVFPIANPRWDAGAYAQTE